MLVTGGVRSGKSRYAERLLPVDGSVTYVAPGQKPDPERDPDWAARVAAHQASRPSAWTTRETADIAAALAAAGETGGPVIVDCLGTWLTAVLDELGWESPDLTERATERIEALATAVGSYSGGLVLVTNEVGWGVVPEYASGRLFRDLLGRTNQRVAEVCDDVILVVAGRALAL